jgi:hypothetical protein
MVSVETDKGPSAMIIFQDRQWAGDPRLGAMSASIDGKRVGLGPSSGMDRPPPVSFGSTTDAIRRAPDDPVGDICECLHTALGWHHRPALTKMGSPPDLSSGALGGPSL